MQLMMNAMSTQVNTNTFPPLTREQARAVNALLRTHWAATPGERKALQHVIGTTSRGRAGGEGLGEGGDGKGGEVREKAEA